MSTEKTPGIWKKRCIMAALSCLVIFLLSWAGYRLLDRVALFQISKITISGTRQCDLERIKELTDPAYGKCIFKVRLPDLYREIRSIGWIKHLSIHRVMPSTLEIQIEERVPLGKIPGTGDQLYLVDAQGVLIDMIRSKKTWAFLPLITGLNLKEPSKENGGAAGMNPAHMMKEGCAVNSSCLQSALQALTLIQAMKNQGLNKGDFTIEIPSAASEGAASGEFAALMEEVSKIELEEPDNIVLCSSKGEVRKIRLAANDDLKEKLMYLQALWGTIQSRTGDIVSHSSESGNPGIAYIDLRYKNQLIVKPL
ncbi:MAG: FtsQ-type POTRA domain-containing protein [bacterium]